MRWPNMTIGSIVLSPCPYLHETFDLVEFFFKEPPPGPGCTGASLEGGAETLALGRRHMFAVAAGGSGLRAS